MLRLVSFNMDYYWASRSQQQSVEVCICLLCSVCHFNIFLPKFSADLSTKQRSRTPHDLESYNALNYVAYALYTPLYLAGPIISFNDFLWQVTSSFTYGVQIISYLLTPGCSFAAHHHLIVLQRQSLPSSSISFVFCSASLQWNSFCTTYMWLPLRTPRLG